METISLKTNAMRYTGISVAVMLALFVVYYAVQLAKATYDPNYEPRINPNSAIRVTVEDLQEASLCAQDIIGAEMKHGFSKTRSDLFWVEFKCGFSNNK